MFEWITISLIDCLRSHFAGDWGGDSESSNAQVIRATNLSDDNIRINYQNAADRFIPTAKLLSKALQPGDIVLEASGGSTDKPVGRVALFEETKNQTILVSNFFRTLRPDQQIVEPKFLCWYLHWAYSQPALRAMQQQTTGIINLKLSEYLQQEVSIPADKAEQLQISNILSELDTQITQTQAIITKLQQVKQGLLQDLLTRGVDQHGQLRPPREKAPELYKQSPLGWIPKEWETARVEELLANHSPAMRSGPFGSALLKHELVDNGIPLLGIDNVYIEEFRADFKRFVTQEKFESLQRYAVRPDDIMITIMGTIGRCCLVPEKIGLALSSKHTWTISLDKEKYSPYLAMIQFNHAPWVLSHLSTDEQGGTMSAIRSETLRSTRLPTPPPKEQETIEKILKEAAIRVIQEISLLKKLKKQKTALMDDLLTGRVRVDALLKNS